MNHFFIEYGSLSGYFSPCVISLWIYLKAAALQLLALIMESMRRIQNTLGRRTTCTAIETNGLTFRHSTQSLVWFIATK